MLWEARCLVLFPFILLFFRAIHFVSSTFVRPPFFASQVRNGIWLEKSVQQCMQQYVRWHKIKCSANTMQVRMQIQFQMKCIQCNAMTGQDMKWFTREGKKEHVWKQHQKKQSLAFCKYSFERLISNTLNVTRWSWYRPSCLKQFPPLYKLPRLACITPCCAHLFIILPFFVCSNIPALM